MNYDENYPQSKQIIVLLEWRPMMAPIPFLVPSTTVHSHPLFMEKVTYKLLYSLLWNRISWLEFVVVVPYYQAGNNRHKERY